MFYYVAKILWFFAGPTNLLVMLAAVGAALLYTRWKRVGRALAAGAAVGLLLIGFSPLGRFVVRTLEDRFPQQTLEDRRVDGIIVLGGAIGFARGQVTFNEAGARMTTAMALAKEHPHARLVVTGGDGRLVGTGPSEAEGAQELFRLAGIEGERLTLEARSRNTRENALFTRELVQPKPGERWLLVTSAMHMPRAVGCFRAVGFAPEAYPVDYRTDGDRRDVFPFYHMFNGMQLTDVATKEWIGLLAYRLTGYTPELLPGPLQDSSTASPAN